MKLYEFAGFWGALHDFVAFTPKGGCPLKHMFSTAFGGNRNATVAFTPKGGCPLKLILTV